uniref:Ig-like domain-containing protein n=1 Tax=Neogobius melanostomus TaxID=47308 RepID=A0A8C6TR13_9GOBI
METLKIVVITVLSMLQKVVQPEGFKTAKLGQTVVLKCFTDSYLRKRLWYKLGSNRRLQLLASTNSLFKPNTHIDNHYSVSSSENETTLTIKDITVKDIGTYFCGIPNTYDVDFGLGTVLEIEGESEPVQSVLQSPEDISVKPGDSTAHEHLLGLLLYPSSLLMKRQDSLPASNLHIF